MRAALAVTVLAAAVVFGLLETLARDFAGPAAGAADAPASRRSEHVIALPNRPEATPAPRGAPSLLLLGNSHTYALPGLRKGEPLRPDPGATLIDELAARVQARVPEKPVDFYLLSYPNFLPMEILIRASQLLDLGHRPNVVILGLTWRNIARGSGVRYAIRSTLQDPAAAERLSQRVRTAQSATLVQQAVDHLTQRAAQDRADASGLGRSTADELDLVVSAYFGDHVSLLGQSSAIRARLYRSFNYGLASLLFSGSNVPTNDVVADDLELNVEALRSLLHVLHQAGALVVCYQAPERSDLPSLVDPARRDEIFARIREDLDRQGGLMLDARHAVPDEFWGWERDRPDASHFTEPGHQRLASFLVEQAAERGVWGQLLATR